MKIPRLLVALLLSVVTTVLCTAQSSDTRPAHEPSGPTRELSELVSKIKAKLSAGQGSASDLAPELAAFDALRAKYSGQRSEEVARITEMQAALYAQVLDDAPKAKAMLERLKVDYSGTPAGARAERVLASLDQMEQVKAARAALIGKPAPELNVSWSTRPGLKKLSDLKGKVVVLDFWATWCGPCVDSFPQVRQLTEHYRGTDVVVLGVTSLQGYIMGLEPRRIETKDPEREKALMKDYIKAKDITWTVAFSDEPVFNEDYGVTGIPHMAIVAPDGTLRHSGMHPAEPHEEKVKKIDALLKEFGKSTRADPNKS